MKEQTADGRGRWQDADGRSRRQEQMAENRVGVEASAESGSARLR